MLKPFAASAYIHTVDPLIVLFLNASFIYCEFHSLVTQC